VSPGCREISGRHTLDQEIKAVQAKVEAVNKEMDRVNATARFGELDVSLQKTIEKQKINFRVQSNNWTSELFNTYCYIFNLN